MRLRLNRKNRLVGSPRDCSIERPEEASDVVKIFVSLFRVTIKQLTALLSGYFISQATGYIVRTVK